MKSEWQRILIPADYLSGGVGKVTESMVEESGQRSAEEMKAQFSGLV